MARPRRFDPLVPLTVKVPKSMLDDLRAEAEGRNQSVTEVVLRRLGSLTKCEPRGRRSTPPTP